MLDLLVGWGPFDQRHVVSIHSLAKITRCMLLDYSDVHIPF